MTDRLIGVFGAGGAGRGILPIAQETNIGTECVFIDDDLAGGTCNGRSVLSLDDFAANPSTQKYVVLAVSEAALRRKLAARVVTAGLAFTQIIAADVVIMDEVSIGEGALLSPGVVITSNVVIGRHFQANIQSYVEHDCRIGDFVTFGPSVRCNGNVTIGDGAYIGCGAMIRQGTASRPLTIGANAVVGMGAVVLQDVPAGTTVVGNPARILQRT